MSFARADTPPDLEKSLTPPSRGEKSNHVRVHANEAVEDVFAKSDGGSGPDYRAVGWGAAAVLLLKQQIGLGVLSLPNVFMTLGIVPGLLVLFFLGFVTTYGGKR